MANNQTIPRIDTKINRNLVSGQMQTANMQSPWRVPDIGSTLSEATKVAVKYYNAEKETAFKRLDLEADKLQQQEWEEIRIATSNEQIPEIENNFKVKLNETFGQDNWGKKWLKERSDLYLAANSRDVMRWKQAKQHELYTLQLNQTLNTWANNISVSDPDKAKVLLNDMVGYIDSSQLLSPTEKQKTKDNIIKVTLQKTASSNPDTAINILQDNNFTKSLDIDAQAQINDIIKKQFAEMKFQEQVKIFNNEREISEKIDEMGTDEALRFLEENETNVSSRYFKAKQKSLLSSKGIDDDTRADEAFDIMQKIASLPTETDEVVEYYRQVDDILSTIEEKYAEGYLSASDRKKFVGDLYKKQGANLENLKSSEKGSEWKFWGYSYKDAAEDIAANYTGKNGNRIMLDYFRKVNDGGEYDTEQKKSILQGLLNQAKAKDLALPYFINEEEARQAYKQGKIKKGDSFYINGRKVHING